ncbi:MAG TPA: D-amino-acid transaminase [Pseudogracilibacillus sp.]|nr:D-amino-acid transaminase [Pseudogracilibacillus sp.]
MDMYPIILVDDKFLHREKLQLPYEERGHQFGDGVYEVIRIYNGKFYLLQEHIDRLFRSLEAIKINFPYSKTDIKNLLQQLLEKNSVDGHGIIYLQVTRGSAPRSHEFPKNTRPNFYAYIKYKERNLDALTTGVSTITTEDTRWKLCHIKSLNLLPNVLAKQAAFERNCYEAILFDENNYVTECSASNIYLLKENKIFTHPATERILHGCVRMAVERFAESLHIPFIEEPFSTVDLIEADEVFLTSSSSEVMPVIRVDNDIINDGKRGMITEQLQHAYEKDANIY